MLNTGFVKAFSIGAIVALAVIGGVVVGQPLLARNQESSYNCPSFIAIPPSFHGSGFLMSKTTGFGPNGMQFVIKPNSTAFLQISYFVGANSVENIYVNSQNTLLRSSIGPE
ncbi:hypothetical protein E6H36_07660 [Candidatus Bathyarchaeota archaeon]|nr:MAG: hypothetical protein E6H36_07660 [Candidatus Bathyarchaeota archaeon]TMI33141.1 MAG: hypothetical protein E6H29_00760 [Candidatus Bathyarchaeota archaeon]